MTKLTLSIPTENYELTTVELKKSLKSTAEAVELRIDYLKELNPAVVNKLIHYVKAGEGKTPAVIVTCKAKQQGGARYYRDAERVEILTHALRAGADFIDFEYESFLNTENRKKLETALAEAPGSRLILSAHNFDQKFDDIGRLYRDIKAAYPASIPKLVYTANHITDCFEAFDLLSKTDGDRIVFCMGRAGLISRIIAKKLNSFLTFASMGLNQETAPGQLSLKLMQKTYRYDKINHETRVYGIIGAPVSHSLSPAVHNCCFSDLDVNAVYLPLLVEGGEAGFRKFMDNITSRKWLGFAGFSVTIPHKQNAIGYVRRTKGFIEPLAGKIGAANTLLLAPDGKAQAYNTDCAGVMDAITSKLGLNRSQLKNLKVSVVGAGGVTRAMVAGLSETGSNIKIYNRTVEKAKQLAQHFNCRYAGLEDLKNLDAQLLVNCTSVGMHPNTEQSPVPKQYLKQVLAVFDTVYNPPETLLLKQASQLGCKTITGLTMFLNQAAVQFKIFTGKNANRQLMRETIGNCFSPK